MSSKFRLETMIWKLINSLRISVIFGTSNCLLQRVLYSDCSFTPLGSADGFFFAIFCYHFSISISYFSSCLSFHFWYIPPCLLDKILQILKWRFVTKTLWVHNNIIEIFSVYNIPIFSHCETPIFWLHAAAAHLLS